MYINYMCSFLDSSRITRLIPDGFGPCRQSISFALP